MENLLQQKTICLSKLVLDKQEECGVYGDFTLPDYCADMSSVISCVMTPHLQNCQSLGNRIMVDGSADVRILYLDEDRCCLRSVEFSLPFSYECKINTVSIPEYVIVDLGTRYVNWRVVSSRRLEIRGSVLIDLQAFVNEEVAISETQDTALQTKTRTINVTNPQHVTEKIITVCEQLDFPQEKPKAELLLGGSCNAEVTECRVLSGKAIVKGNVYVHQLYTDNIDAGTTHCLDYVIPFSQILDVDGAYENQLHNVQVMCLSDIERCLVGPDGDQTVLEVCAKLLIQLCIWDDNAVTVLVDAYHPSYPVSLEYDDLTHSTFLGCKTETTFIPVPVEIGHGEFSELLDVLVEPVDYEVNVQDSAAVFNGKFHVVILARDCDKRITCYQKYEDFRLEFPCVGDTVHAKLTLTDVQYSMDDDCVHLRLRISSAISMYKQCDCRTVSAIRMNEGGGYAKDSGNLLIYYAESGESIWDIGRRCHASVKDICAENAITDDVVPAPMLLSIPL